MVVIWILLFSESRTFVFNGLNWNWKNLNYFIYTLCSYVLKLNKWKHLLFMKFLKSPNSLKHPVLQWYIQCTTQTSCISLLKQGISTIFIDQMWTSFSKKHFLSWHQNFQTKRRYIWELKLRNLKLTVRSKILGTCIGASMTFRRGTSLDVT